MKKSSGQLILFLLLVFSIAGCRSKVQPLENDAPAEGTAILITGAAARIPQEAALLERLYDTGQLKNVQFIGGASSGALNAVMLNGILTGKITWKQYESWLSEIRNDSIYINHDKRLPVDTHPLRNYLTHIINDSLGYYKMKDLPIATAISITELNAVDFPKRNFRLSNRKINQESDPNLNIIDVLMASTAIPMVFPEQKIPGSTTLPDRHFVDGGIGEDHVPYSGLIDYMKEGNRNVKKVIIVSRKSDLEPDVNKELAMVGVDTLRIFDHFGFSLDEILQKGFLEGLERYTQQLPQLVNNTYVYIPDFKQKFLLLDFNDLKEQYELTKNWALKNNPTPLKNYLEKFTATET